MSRVRNDSSELLENFLHGGEEDSSVGGSQSYVVTAVERQGVNNEKILI